MQETLEIDAFVAIANYLILILQGKGLQAVKIINEAKMDKTGLEVDGKGNGEKSAFLNLNGTVILYNFLNLLLWLGQMKP